MNRVKLTTLAFAIALASSPANALTFQFDINNVEGNFAGTLTGFVSGLVDDTANQKAASVTLQSTPLSMPGALAGPIDFVNDFGMPLVNSFSVSAGEITAAQFGIQVLNADLPDVDPDVFESLLFVINAGVLTQCCGTINNGISFDNTLSFLGNDDGANGIDFSEVSTIPVPASGQLMIGAICVFGALRQRKRGVLKSKTSVA